MARRRRSRQIGLPISLAVPVVAMLVAAASPVPGKVMVRIGKVDTADVAVCPVEMRAMAMRTERAGLAQRTNALTRDFTRGEMERLLDIRIAIAEQDETALTALIDRLGDNNPNHAGLTLALARVRSDPALLRAAANAYARWARRQGRTSPFFADTRRSQARALLALAAAEPAQAPGLIAEARSLLPKAPPADDDDALFRAEIDDAADYQLRGPGDAQLAAYRQLIATSGDSDQRALGRAGLVERLMHAAAARPAARAALLAEALAVAREGEVRASSVAPDADVLARVAGDLIGSWATHVGPRTHCLEVASWRILVARAGLALAESAAERANERPAARAALTAAEAMVAGLPPWLRDPHPALELTQSWLVAARSLPPAERAPAVTAARVALDRARLLSNHCFCATIKVRVARLAGDPLLS